MMIEKKTYRSGPYQDFFAQGTQVGIVLYLSGQVGIDRDGNPPTSIADQTKVAYTNMQDVLSHCYARDYLVVRKLSKKTPRFWFQAHGRTHSAKTLLATNYGATLEDRIRAYL